MRAESSRTIAHYESRAESFWEGTRDHDVSQNLNALLDACRGSAPLRILDFGCGPGRDVLALKLRGHEPTGLDGTERFAQMARELSGCPVLHQDFLALDLPDGAFDGVFCNASLFHVPSESLPRVLAQIHRTLRHGGVLFCSNPRPMGAESSEGFQGERFVCNFDLDRWCAVITPAGFALEHHYYRPEGLPQTEQPWLAQIYRRV
jgi:SAM-dependent methyltransferase